MNMYESTNIRPYHILILGVLGILLLVVFSLAPNAFTNITAFCYPAYQTLLILRHGTTATVQQSQYRQWFMYWLIVFSLTLLESITDTLVLWVPLYYSLKLGLIVWMIHPAIRGAEQIYMYSSPIIFKMIDAIESYLHTYTATGETNSSAYVKTKSHEA
uniref:Receptor expression-enhancing protein n=1 Tax=Lygus hesperus TaxID=30085 RepID=A0A0A9XZG2_LYGHE